MTKYKYVLSLSALVFLTVFATAIVYAATRAKDKPQCPPAEHACSQANTSTCYYRFTVKEDKKDSLVVKYPASVFSITQKDEREKPREVEYENSNKDRSFTVFVKPDTKVEKEATYTFTRCPESLYDRGEKDPKDEPAPKKR
jgi:hypothetical protein